MATAAALDTARLGKQRTEALQILQHLLDDGPMVGNPHAYNMWVGWEGHLAFYGMCMAHEWMMRGYDDNTSYRFKEIIDDGDGLHLVFPPWMEDLWMLRSHRSRLVEKLPSHYGALFPNTPANMPYLWPVNEKGGYYLRLSKADMSRLETGERSLPTYAWVHQETGRIEIDHEYDGVDRSRRRRVVGRRHRGRPAARA
jgi:hypothetical protein